MKDKASRSKKLSAENNQ